MSGPCASRILHGLVDRPKQLFRRLQRRCGPGCLIQLLAESRDRVVRLAPTPIVSLKGAIVRPRVLRRFGKEAFRLELVRAARLRSGGRVMHQVQECTLGGEDPLDGVGGRRRRVHIGREGRDPVHTEFAPDHVLVGGHLVPEHRSAQGGEGEFTPLLHARVSADTHVPFESLQVLREPAKHSLRAAPQVKVRYPFSYKFEEAQGEERKRVAIGVDRPRFEVSRSLHLPVGPQRKRPAFLASQSCATSSASCPGRANSRRAAGEVWCRIRRSCPIQLGIQRVRQAPSARSGEPVPAARTVLPMPVAANAGRATSNQCAREGWRMLRGIARSRPGGQRASRLRAGAPGAGSSAPRRGIRPRRPARRWTSRQFATGESRKSSRISPSPTLPVIW